MANISAAQVKSLRDKTGISMGDCKKALVETDGNEEQALDILKKKYEGKLDTRAHKEAANGRIGAYTDGKIGALVELRCETDFVANNKDFVTAANDIAKLSADTGITDVNTLLETKGQDGRTAKDIIAEAYGKLQEKIVLERSQTIKNGAAWYVHHNGLIGTIVAAEDANPEVAKHICMHVAAQKVLSGLKRDDVNQKEVEEARSIMMEQAKGKPEEIATKIVDGKMNKWYGERVLLEQPFAMDDKKTVGQIAEEAKMKIVGYLKYELGVK